ncbi:MAG: hypothetical protein NXI31_03280 [bacterium]|nr:hypothetical protein [bacterium]
MTTAWFRRLLGVCPILIGLLWIAGIARFRGMELGTVEWLALVAVAFALHVITRRARRPRPLPPLPADANPSSLALFAAGIVGTLIGLLGALFEWIVESYQPSNVPLALRALWHGACAFAAGYCGFLLRLHEALRKPRKTGNGGSGGGDSGGGEPPADDAD